ncbi:hypothetical protein H8356DRAFT_1679266 [Neocallimastix lanati (nom. inval.)]|nr:hypothetical protein H8356DRAFT_1679266 [Neocallimastix sp. JGI-2020a]
MRTLNFCLFALISIFGLMMVKVNSKPIQIELINPSDIESEIETIFPENEEKTNGSFSFFNIFGIFFNNSNNNSSENKEEPTEDVTEDVSEIISSSIEFDYIEFIGGITPVINPVDDVFKNEEISTTKPTEDVTEEVSGTISSSIEFEYIEFVGGITPVINPVDDVFENEEITTDVFGI